KNLSLRGANVEVWAASTSSLAGWNNDFVKDDESQLGFKLRRFPTKRMGERLFHRVHKSMNKEGGTNFLTRYFWVKTNLTGVGMEQALLKNESRFDSIHICHYLSGSAHRLSGLVHRKTLLHPFIHDEAPLRNPVMRHFFAGSRGVLSNSPAEI